MDETPVITSAADYLSNSASTARAAVETLASTLVENELVSSSVSVGEAMPLNDIFGSSSEAAEQTQATSVPSSSSSVQPQPQSQSPLSMSHLVREQGSKIRELETVNAPRTSLLHLYRMKYKSCGPTPGKRS
jgi:hypothetical protein